MKNPRKGFWVFPDSELGSLPLQRLSDDHYGKYWRLRLQCWSDHGLPNDHAKLAWMIGCKPDAFADFWQNVAPLFIVTEEGILYDAELLRKWSESEQKAETSRLNGSQGGRPRKPGGFKKKPSKTQQVILETQHEPNITQPSPAHAGNGIGIGTGKGKEQAEVVDVVAKIPEWIPKDPWNGFVEMRKRIKKPMTDRAMQLCVVELQRYRSQGHNVGELLDLATKNSWQGIYLPKDAKGKPLAANGSEGGYRSSEDFDR